MSVQNQTKVCPNCSYDANPFHFTKCEICGESLSSQQLTALITNEDEARILDPGELRRKNPHLVKNYQEKSNKTKINYQNKSTKSIFNKPWQKELLKPQNASGVIVAILSLYLLTNNLLANKNDTEVNKQVNTEQSGIELVASIKDVNSVPSGIFSYSGDGYFAALLANGLAEEIIKAFPNFDFRYRIPDNQNPDYSVAIDMLLRGEIDFVFNGRPLSSTEYNKAKLQGVTLTEKAIARDGIVFYTNPELGVSKITLSQLVAIFRGEISNWQQLGGEDLAITPVILSKENTESLGFEVSERAKIQYASSHTLAVRKTISTPGAIGYASASLVQNQKLLKFLTLGKANRFNPSVIDYVPPFIGAGKPNKEAFEQGTYPLTRELNLVWSNLGDSQAAGVASANSLLSYQGQHIVDKSGFVSLRDLSGN